MIHIKSQAEVALMRAAGLVVAQTLATVTSAVAPGVSPRELNAIAEAQIRSRGAVPSFLGYHGFPATLCVSVNDEIVHGIPGDRPLRAGDVVSIDCGAILDGWHGDSAVTVPVGSVSDEARGLIETCDAALWAGIAAMQADGRMRDIGVAVEGHIRSSGRYAIVEEYGGHGIGTEMHQDPHVPNYRTRARGPRLVPGLVLAIEPMINLGGRETVTLSDGWTVKTVDGSWSAHFEHTVAVTSDGPWVLTALDGGAARLAELGVPTPAVAT